MDAGVCRGMSNACAPKTNQAARIAKIEPIGKPAHRELSFGLFLPNVTGFRVRSMSTPWLLGSLLGFSVMIRRPIERPVISEWRVSRMVRSGNFAPQALE